MIKKKLICSAAVAFISSICASTVQAAPEAAQLVAPPMQLPAPYSFLNVCFLLTFFLHLVLVNILLGSVILAVIDRRNSESTSKTGISFMPKVLALAINFGVAPFLFLQVIYGNYLYPTIVFMAVWWLSIVLFVMLAYYGLYVGDAESRASRRLPVLALAVLCLLATAFFLTNLSTLMLRPDEWLRWFSEPHGTILNFGDRTLLPRYLHMIVASLAVGGLVMAWRARWSKGQPGVNAAEADKHMRRGLDWFFYASLSQVAVGGLFLFFQPPAIRALFLGSNLLATLALALVLTGLGISLVLARRGQLKLTSIMVLGLILLMICVRDMLRVAMLQPYIEAAAAPTPLAMPEGQTAAMALFLVCVVIAIIVIVWIARTISQVLKRMNTSGTQES